MILSRNDIETIAIGVMHDFNAFFWDSLYRPHVSPQATPIDQFATDYLGLDVTFQHLSDDGNFCGLTAYADTEFQLDINGVVQKIPLKQNQVILDTSFITPGRVKNLCGKRRFTLAHECAHQILFQLENDQNKTACRKMYACRTAYSLRELKTREDWNEWQANALGSAILMPWSEVEIAMKKHKILGPLKSYDGHFPYMDKIALNALCRTFAVSKSAMVIRLEQMGYLKRLPRFQFHDPVEVWV